MMTSDPVAAMADTMRNVAALNSTIRANRSWKLAQCVFLASGTLLGAAVGFWSASPGWGCFTASMLHLLHGMALSPPKKGG